MTAADKLRELLASRPAMPNTEELVRWWRTGGELVLELLNQRVRAAAAAQVYAERVDVLGLAVDDNDPEVMALAQPIGEAQADLFAAVGLLELDASGRVGVRPPVESVEQLRAERDKARMLARVRGEQLAEACGLAEQYKADSEHNAKAATALRAERDEAKMLARDAQIQAMDRGASYQAVVAELEKLKADRQAFAETTKEPQTFEAGDVVRLRAVVSIPAGHPMTIENVCAYVPGTGVGVACVWFDDAANLQRAVFDPRQLEHAPDEDVPLKCCPRFTWGDGTHDLNCQGEDSSR